MIRKCLQAAGVVAGIINVALAASSHNWDAALGWGVATILFIANLADD